MIWASLATIPNRPVEAVMRSLRPQVDVLAVHVNGPVVPECVRELADEVIHDPQDKLRCMSRLVWVEEARKRGCSTYLPVDDDLLYPHNYAEVMAYEVAQWHGEALVSLLTRRYEGTVTRWLEPSARIYWDSELRVGAWHNFPGVGVMAFDPRKHAIPCELAPYGSDGYIAEWAQRNHVPIWNPPHPQGWLKYLLPAGADTIWDRAAASGFAVENEWISTRPFQWVTFLPAGL
jgi:hypothetical protein